MKWKLFEKYQKDMFDESILYEKKISGAEVVADYYNFKQELYEKEIKPALIQLEASKKAYYESLVSLLAIEDNHDDYYRKAIDLSGLYPINGASLHIRGLVDFDQYPLIKNEELSYIENHKKLPEGI